jgi:hypothetical protein
MTTKAVVVAAAALVALTAAAPDVTVLAARAVHLVHSHRQFRHAVLLEADGTPGASHTVKTARGIVKWRFVFDNQATGGRYKSATVLAVRGQLGKVRGYTQPFLEDQPIRTIPRMTLARAIDLLRGAGYTQAFYAVTLRKPLYPGVKHAEYIVTIGYRKYVAVDTQTGKVKPVS